MDERKQRIAENQIHGILQAAMTLAADYELHETEQDLVILAQKIRDRREYLYRKTLHAKSEADLGRELDAARDRREANTKGRR